MTKNKLKQLYTEDGLTIRAIADELNLTYTRVREMLTMYGIELRTKHGEKKENK